MREPRPATFAFVMWPDAFDPTVPSCIYLVGLSDALARGAVVIAREDAELCEPVRAFNTTRIAQGDGDCGDD